MNRLFKEKSYILGFVLYFIGFILLINIVDFLLSISIILMVSGVAFMLETQEKLNLRILEKKLINIIYGKSLNKVKKKK